MSQPVKVKALIISVLHIVQSDTGSVSTNHCVVAFITQEAFGENTNKQKTLYFSMKMMCQASRADTLVQDLPVP